MNKKELSNMERRLASALTRNGQESVTKLAERLDVTAPTIRSHLKSMITSGVMKITGLVSPAKVKGITVAIVGINIESHGNLDEKLEQISSLGRVHWCAVVTGRYDILAEIVCTEGTDDLYDFLDKDLKSVGGIHTSESFMVMKSRRKWLYLPELVAERFTK